MTHAAPIIYDRDQHQISRHNIDPDALKIMYRLIRSGYKAFLVGGAVRDLLLDKSPKDYDISTDATPRKIKALFRNSRIIGRRFKLVHVFFQGNKIIEVSTFRDETEVDAETTSEGMITDNVYGDESTDAARRDLTINGLFYDLSTFAVIDYVGGMQDLRDGIIRVIGDPDTRFHEDPVRLLRVIRHAARNNFKVDSASWESLIRNRELIMKSSQVRVYEELRKDFSSGHLFEILKLFANSGLLDFILPIVSERQDQLLGIKCGFSDAIRKIDKYSNREAELSTTVILSIITLALMDLEEPGSMQDEEAIIDFTKKVFISLTVPRKERERIVALLDSIRYISTHDLKKIRVTQLTKKSYFNDMLTLIRVSGNQFVTPEVAEFLEEAQGAAKKDRQRHAEKHKTRHVGRPRNAPMRRH